MKQIILLDAKVLVKWIKYQLQTPFPLGFSDNVYHEGNISKIADFDVFSLFGISLT